MSDKAPVVRVRDVMKREFEVIDGMMTIAEALKLMKERDAEGLIVNKRHDDDEYGMLLISDIARHVLGQDRSPSRVNAYEVMAKPVISVDPGMDIRYCARLFQRFRIARAPVLEDGRVVGIVSFTDLVLRGVTRNL